MGHRLHFPNYEHNEPLTELDEEGDESVVGVCYYNQPELFGQYWARRVTEDLSCGLRIERYEILGTKRVDPVTKLPLIMSVDGKPHLVVWEISGSGYSARRWIAKGQWGNDADIALVSVAGQESKMVDVTNL